MSVSNRPGTAPRGRLRLLSAYYRRFRMKSLSDTFAAVRDPARVRGHFRNVFAGRVVEATNPYRPTFSRPAEARFCAALLDRPVVAIEDVFAELDADRAFIADLRSRYREGRPGAREDLDPGRFRIWYAIVRIRRPEVVIETGVHDGLSSALILRALDRNGAGGLISVDLPSIDLPRGGPGWLVSAELRARWQLRLGDARKLLPELVASNPAVDIFIHDSDHSREHREFEFRAVRPALGLDGLLLSDDAADDLLDELAAEWGGEHHTVRCDLPDDDSAHIGGLRLGSRD